MESVGEDDEPDPRGPRSHKYQGISQIDDLILQDTFVEHNYTNYISIY